MTSVAPPTEFFPGIDFNPSFYNLGQSAVTLDYLNSNFLRSTGYAISRAQFTLFNGTVDINENLDVSGNINASAYLLNGVPFTPSQWTTSVNDIYYTTGNVGIGKTNPTYKLDVSGNVNCNAIFTNGTQLTQYTDANVRTVLGTSAGTNMTWNTGTNKFDVAAPYTDTNVRTVLSTSAGSNMTWNTGTNKFDVSVPPSYTDTNVRTVLSTSAGTNMTWNTGTNKFDVSVPASYTDTNVRTVLSTSAGTNMTWNTGTNKFDVAAPYTLPTATNTILGGVKSGNDISVNPTTGIMSLSGNDISLNGTANRAYGWASSTSLLGRCSVAAAYSTNSLINDVVLRSANNLILQSGTTTSALIINTSNQAFFRNGVGINKTSITSGFILDVNGDVVIGNSICIGTTTTLASYGLNVNANIITSGNIALANASRSIFWTGTNSNLARAGVAGEYSTSAAINDIVLRSGNKLILQSGTGASGIMIDTANNVYIGASTNSSDDGNVNIAIPDSTFYVRGPRTIGSTTNISFRGGLEGNSNGKVRIWMSSDAAHSSYIESHHTGNGNTNLMFGTSNGNALPTERMRIENNGTTSISGDLFITSSRLVLRGTAPTLYLRDTDNRSGMIHMNSNVMYFLNANGNDSETWAQQNGQNWALQIDMNNNTATFGGSISGGSNLFISGYSTIGSYISVSGSGTFGSLFASGASSIYNNLEVTGSLNVSQNIRHQTDRWHTSSDGRHRFYFGGSATTYYSGGMSGGANVRMHEYRRTYDDATLGWFENTGLLRSYGYSSLSDSRIKKNIRDIDDTQGLEKILLIQPKKYNYIEKERNKHDVIGFIAQQIGEVIPEAITKTEGIVPNIYKNCLVNNKREIYYSLPLDVVIDTDVIITDTEDGTGERYKIKEIYDDYFIIDKDIDRDEVFVKGYSINDLHNLDKNYIYTLNVCATQELYKLIMEQREEINNLKNRLSTLENINNRQ
jgi:hypothetical protein